MSTHVLLLGVTGPSGVPLLAACMEKGYKLTILARNPSKLPESVSRNPDVSIIKGEFNDEARLQEAASCGAKILITFAGPALGKREGTPISDAYKLLIPHLIANHFERALILSTPSYHVPEDSIGIKWFAGEYFIKIVGGSAYNEITTFSAFVSSQLVDQLPWTLFRVPFLNNGEEKPVNACFLGSGKDGTFLSRKSMAAWLLTEIDEKKWIGKAPFISN